MSSSRDGNAPPGAHFDKKTRLWYQHDKRTKQYICLDPQPPAPRSSRDNIKHADEAFGRSVKRSNNEPPGELGQQNPSPLNEDDPVLHTDLEGLSLSPQLSPPIPEEREYSFAPAPHYDTYEQERSSGLRKEKRSRQPNSGSRRQGQASKQPFRNQEWRQGDNEDDTYANAPDHDTGMYDEDEDIREERYGTKPVSHAPERLPKQRRRKQSFMEPNLNEAVTAARARRPSMRHEDEDDVDPHQDNDPDAARWHRENVQGTTWEEAENDGAMPKLLFSPAEETTEIGLFQNGVRARAKVIGRSSNRRQELDPRYVKQSNPQDFFCVGRVFKIFWPELRGNATENKTVITLRSTRFQGVPMIAKIRWFVVAKTGHKSCTCLPIATYERHGVGKKDVIKNEHCIVYTDREPMLLDGEKPGPGELGMRTSIPVVPTNPGTRLDDASRLNYRKVYTVEHNVRVMDFGTVHPKFLHTFADEWFAVWFPEEAARQAHTNSTRGQDDDDDDELTGQLEGAQDPSSGNGKKRKSGNKASTKKSSSTAAFKPSYISHGEAIITYVPSEEDEARELRIRKGDLLAIESVPYNDWAMAFNRKTSQRGLVALQNMIMHETATALHDYDPPNADAKGFASLRAGDVVYVTERPPGAPDWAMIWNVRTNEHGLAPSGRLSSPDHPSQR